MTNKSWEIDNKYWVIANQLCGHKTATCKHNRLRPSYQILNSSASAAYFQHSWKHLGEENTGG